jgi:DNA-binding MarR family transcriptional regulator
MEPTVELADALRESIGRIVRATRGRVDTLPPAHSATLGLLDRQGPMTIADLARLRGVKHQGQSRSIGELEERGFVTRATSAEDGRVSVIAITDSGTAVVLADRRSRSEWLAAAIEQGLTPEERDLLERVPPLLFRIAQRVEP